MFALAATLTLFAAALVVAESLRRRDKARKPPGPPGLPFIGNLLDVPTTFDWLTYTKWAHEYGDLMSLSVPGTTVLIISSYSKAIDLLEGKGSVYSSRPYVAMTGDLMGYDRAGLIPYGSRFKSTRKLYSRELGSHSRIQEFHSHLESQSLDFIEVLKKDPDNLLDQTYVHAGAIILRIAYGYHLTSRDDDILHITNEAMDQFSASLYPGRFLCNQIPILRHLPDWMPGAGFKRTAKIWAQKYQDMNQVPFNFTKSQMSAGKAEESFISKALPSCTSDEERDNLMYAAGTMSAAGSETSAVTLYVFFIMLVRYPDIYNRLRAEVDNIVGRDRTPTLKDTEEMPFLDAVTKEVLRFHPAVPLCLPHATLVDDMYEGYFIPKGTTVLPNLWFMCRDPSVYKNPDEFNPDRFLGEHPEPEPRDIVFGFGRRICPGRLLAEAGIRITEAMALWSFDFGPVEVDGRVVIPEYKPMGGVVSHLEPMKIKLTPRS